MKHTTIKTSKYSTINKYNRKLTKKHTSTGLFAGCHASIADGVLNSIKYVETIGGNAVQIFLGSRSSSSLKMKTKLTPEEINDIKNYSHHNKIKLITKEDINFYCVIKRGIFHFSN